MTYKYNDGGRSAAGYKGTARDCCARAMAIAIGLDYDAAYNEIAKANKSYGSKKSARNGVAILVYEEVLKKHGWVWCKAPTFTGRKARCSDLTGIVIAKMARHVVAVVDGVPNDTWNSSAKMVYGYYAKK